jgi:hypothetical protein
VQELNRSKELDEHKDNIDDADNNKNEPEMLPPVNQQPQKQGQGRLRKYPLLIAVTDVTLHLKNDSQVTPFAASRQKEITSLLEKGVFKVIKQDDIPQGVRLFNSRFVNKVKH